MPRLKTRRLLRRKLLLLCGITAAGLIAAFTWLCLAPGSKAPGQETPFPQSANPAQSYPTAPPPASAPSDSTRVAPRGEANAPPASTDSPAAQLTGVPSGMAALPGASLEKDPRATGKRFAGEVPSAWGESIPGVYTHLAPSVDGRVRVALTLDACGGGSKGNGVDLGIIELLEKNKIPATLFLNARWINANPGIAAYLTANPLFELENHGFKHKPLSVNGRAVYGITGTASPEEAASEVEAGAQRLAELTGKRPLFFRSGTAYYDDVAVKIIAALDLKPAGFSIIGDAGATLPAPEVAARLRAAKDGDIVILHFNRPGSGTYEGLREALPDLLARGVIFVRLADVKLE